MLKGHHMNERNLKKGGITAEEAPILGSKGGHASVKARREKKLLSQVYGEFLADKFSVTIDGRSKKVTGAEFLKYVARKIAARGDATTVALMKEIREATEGNKAVLTGALDKDLFPTEIVIRLVRPGDPDA